VARHSLTRGSRVLCDGFIRRIVYACVFIHRIVAYSYFSLSNPPGTTVRHAE
jgi:hypothetical protein